MGTPRLICKSAYIRDIRHYFDTLEYAGNKIHKQLLVYKDGSTRELPDDKRILLSDTEREQIAGVTITFKEGNSKTISYARYLQCTKEVTDTVRVANFMEVRNDAKAFNADDGNDSEFRELWNMDLERYLSYIEARPGVEKEGGHGLFGLTGNISIEDAKAMALKHKDSPKWSHIISMDALDAKRTGFDNREAWKNLIISKAPEIAQAYNISLCNLVINCSYHGNTDNPHNHLLFYSKDKTEGFVTGGTSGMNKASETLKSTIVNEIFKDETVALGRSKHSLRVKFMEQLNESIAKATAEPVADEFVSKLEQLSLKLPSKGRIVYEYLPKELKSEVDDLLKTAVTGSPALSQTFDEYSKVQEQMILRYVINPQQLKRKLDKWENNFFHPAKKSDLRQHHNLIVRAAVQLADSRNRWLRTFEEQNGDSDMQELNLSSQGGDFIKVADSLDTEGNTGNEVSDVFTRTFERQNANYAMSELDLSRQNVNSVKKSDEMTTYNNLIRNKQLQNPLKQLLRRNLNACLVDDNSFTALWVKRQLEKIRVGGTPADTAQLVAFLYQTSKEIRLLVDNQAGVLYQQLKSTMSPKQATAFYERYKEDVVHGKFLPAHGSVWRYAQNLDENYYFVLSQKHRAVFSDLHKTVVKGLWELLDKEQLTELRQLHDLLAIPQKNQQAIIDCKLSIYRKLLSSSERCQFTENLAQRFHSVILDEVDANLAQTLYERVRTDIYTGDLGTTNFIICNFARSIDTHLAESFLKKQLKHERVHNYRTELYSAMRRVHSENTSELARIQLLAMHPDRKNMDEILFLISTDGGQHLRDLRQQMYKNLYTDYVLGTDKPLTTSEFNRVIDTFFYGENGNSFFFGELIQSAAADNTFPIPTLFIAKSAIISLARIICLQQTERKEETDFKPHKHFENIGFERPKQFINY